jgi:hypothetical protein
MVTNKSRQKIMKILGEYGCYFLSVVHLAEEITKRRIDAVEVFVKALENKWVDDEATMLCPDAILSDLSGKKFTIIAESPAYIPKAGEHEIILFKNGSFQHFVLGDNSGNVAYDPLEEAFFKRDIQRRYTRRRDERSPSPIRIFTSWAHSFFFSFTFLLTILLASCNLYVRHN